MPKIDLEAIQAKIDSQNLTLSEKPPSPTIGDYSDHERKLVNWFFASMRTQWGVAKYNSQFGEGDDVQFAKRHWAPRIVKYSPEQLKSMLEQADSQRISGNQNFAWPDPASILSLQDNAWERRAHKVYQPETLIENLSAKEARISAGLEALSSLKKLDYKPVAGKGKRTNWEARSLAEERAWVDQCAGLLASANHRYPNNPEMAGAVFSEERDRAIRRQWG